MEAYILQEKDFRGSVQLQTGSHRSLYSYSLWRHCSGEHLFDGVAADLADALDTVKACFSFLSTQGGAPSRE